MRKKQPDRLDYHTLRYTKYDPLSVTAMGEFMFSGSEQTYVLKGGITNTVSVGRTSEVNWTV